MLVFALVFVCAVIYYINYRRLRKPLYEISDILPTVGHLPVIGHTHWFLGGPEKLLKNIKLLAEQVDATGGASKVWIGPSLYFRLYTENIANSTGETALYLNESGLLDDVSETMVDKLNGIDQHHRRSEREYTFVNTRVTLNPEDVQKILENCLEKDSSYKFLQTWLGNGLFVAPVDLWKAHRRVLLPIFHNRIIEDYMPVFGEQAAILVQRLEEQVGMPEFDVYKYITSCMLDIVFETAMGEKMDVQHNPDTPYLRARSCVMSIINMRLFKAWLQPDALFNLTPYAKIQKESIDLTHKFTDEVVMKKREQCDNEDQEKPGRKDLLELLLNKEMKFTNEQLREHIDSITIAGNDTTALVIAYALLLLGSHEEEQAKVINELKSIFGDSDRIPTKEDISKMDYLERVIKETMRLYTVVPIIGRKTSKETKLTNFTLPAGVGCGVLPFVMHRSKRLWGPDADCFDPDRFLPENSVDRHPCAFIPFSYGSRNCIGRHFGMMLMKSVLATTLRTYKIKSKAIDRLKIEILLFPVPGHMISIEKRNP